MRLDRNILSRAAVAAVRRGRPFSSGEKGRLLRGIFISSYRRVGIVRSVEHEAAAAADQAPVHASATSHTFGPLSPYDPLVATLPSERSARHNAPLRQTVLASPTVHMVTRISSLAAPLALAARPINTQFAILSTQHLRLMPGPPKRGLSRHATHCPQSDVTCCAVVIVFEPALTGA